MRPVLLTSPPCGGQSVCRSCNSGLGLWAVMPVWSCVCASATVNGSTGLYWQCPSGPVCQLGPGTFVDSQCTEPAVIDGGVDQAAAGNRDGAAKDASIVDAPRIDSAVVDAGECRAEISELSTQGWIRPCASLVDAGVPNPTCIGEAPGLYLFRATCDQRETWLWSYGGTHSQECFYDHGALVPDFAARQLVATEPSGTSSRTRDTPRMSSIPSNSMIACRLASHSQLNHKAMRLRSSPIGPPRRCRRT